MVLSEFTVSQDLYNSIALFNAALLLLGLAGAMFSFVFMILRWKTPKRRGHVIRLLLSLGGIGFAFAFHFFILFGVYLPALGREQMAIANAATEERFRESTYVFVGDFSPEFALTDIDGESFSMAEAKGKVVLINFFVTWCGPCITELPHVEQLWKKHKADERFCLIVIGREETDESVRAFREEHGFTFPMAADPQRSVYSRFAKEAIPRTIVVAPDGEVVYAKMGFMEADLDLLEEVLDEQLSAAK